MRLRHSHERGGGRLRSGLLVLPWEKTLTGGHYLSTFSLTSELRDNEGWIMSKLTSRRSRHLAAGRVEVSLAGLPPTFTYSQARRAGLDHRSLYALRDAGVLEVLGRGLYRRADADLVDPTLTEAAVRAPRATLCLTSALVFHDLSDAIPPAPHLALPRGTRFPALAGPVAWHGFAAPTFDLGRDMLDVGDDLQLGVYSAERAIVDAFRLRHLQGEDEAYEALRRWLRRRGSQPASLLAMATHFPRSLAPVRQALAILL